MNTEKRSFKLNSRATIIYSLALTALLIVIGGGLYIGSHSSSPASANETVQSIQQPPTAAQIASEEHCTNYTDKMTKGGWPTVLDVGNCYVGSVKYAINTFANPANRDAWLKVASAVGVVPVWETSTSVTYKSVDG